MTRSISLGGVLAGVLIALAPAVAEAHVAVQTLELFAGALHPWMNLESGLTLSGLTLWLAQAARPTDLVPFVASGGCVLAGVALGLWMDVPGPPPFAYGIALVAGSLPCLNLKIPRRAGLLALGSMASIAGYLAGVDAASDAQTPLYFLAGAFSGALVLPLSVAALVANCDWSPVRIGVRVLGSWISAISLMLLALTLRG